MSTLSHEELKSVIAAGHAPAVSIFLPTHRAGPEIQQDSIRLKNLVKQAERQLLAESGRAASARELLAPVTNLLDDAAFWRHQGDGLAIFRSEDLFRVYRLPVSVQEFVSVSDRFYVKPLLPLLMNDARFYVLALSQKAVRLLECTRDLVQEVELPDVPQGVQEGLPIGPAPEFQRYTLPVGGPQGGRLHGHGVGIDDADITNLTRYFHRIDDGLKNILKQADAPLVLACVEYQAPIFREAASYRHILEPIIPGNPDGLPNEELQRKAWLIVEPHVRRAQAAATAQYHEGITKGRAGNRLSEILPAAHQGRIATLFVPLGVRRWGRFHFDSLTLEEHDKEEPGDDELLDLAAMQTMMHGGTVYGVKPEEIPGGQLLAGVYRF
jgi:Bacterial archaeo-eukaryotic release factor family 3